MKLSLFVQDSSTHGRANRPRRGHATGGSVAALVAMLLLGASRTAFASGQGEDAGVFFERYVRPLLVSRCTNAIEAGRNCGAAWTSSWEGWQTGGDRGPAIEPGNPDTSLLIQAVRYQDEDLQMPPKGRLPDREVAVLTRWVAMGAPGPASWRRSEARNTRIDIERGNVLGVSTPRRAGGPHVRDTSWSRTPLDRFVLAALEQKGLRPAPAADKRTLIRRATFDLTGLPPMSAEIDAFLADGEPDALARVVDRLLASPHYGER